ncbi:Uncharacterised protein [Shigella sonnei]|nr:Uncharacterised protein [Shigella sonnei]
MRQLAEIDVFRDGHFRHEMQFLVNNRHTRVKCCGRVGKGHFLPINHYRTRGWRIVAAEDF